MEQGQTPTDAEVDKLLAVISGDQPAVITQREWDVVKWQVYDTHRAIEELEAHLKPALAQIMSGGSLNIGAMLFGKRGK